MSEINRGTKLTSYEQAMGETQRTRNGKPVPFMVYIYPNEKAAIDSLKQLSFIKVDENSSNMISTEILSYGYYQINPTVYHAVISGFDIKPEFWNEAKTVFEKYSGKCLASNEPENLPTQNQKPEQGDNVVFVKEYQEFKTINMGGKVEQIAMTYKVYRAGNAQAATNYLNSHPVDINFLYLVVETPEGNYCRDIQGVYKE